MMFRPFFIGFAAFATTALILYVDAGAAFA